MKYYTKEWYENCQKSQYCVGFEPIEDRDYSDAEIQKLYERKLREYIAEEKETYETEPDYLMDVDDITPEMVAEGIFLDVNEETGEKRVITDIEELKAKMLEEQAEARREFESKPPFDPSEAEKEFRDAYESSLEYGCGLPDEVKDEADYRLAALGYLKKGLYRRLKKECGKALKYVDSVETKAMKELGRQAALLPDELPDAMPSHDADLLSFTRTGNDIRMRFLPEEDGPVSCFETVFSDAEFIENEIGEPGKVTGEVLQDMHPTFLYDELYKTESGIEAHMMFSGDELRYVTLRCSGIKKHELDEN